MLGFRPLAFLFLAMPFAAAHADLPLCSADLPQGTDCQADLTQVHPTQFAVGMMEVTEKRDEMAAMDSSQLEKYLAKHVMPCVIGPDGVLYATDAHHDGLAALLAGISLYPAKILADFQGMDAAGFWAQMETSSWVYLYDENGQGPQDPSMLPAHLNELRNDNYRSLAWAVRENGGYEKTDAPFADFLWANFFRARIDASLVQDQFDQATTEAMTLAQSPEASSLPGYVGDR